MKSWLWTTLLLAGLGLSVPVQQWIDGRRGTAAMLEESLYVSSGATLKRASLGYHALLADLYWLRTIQYFGSKIPDSKTVTISDVSSWQLDLFEPLLKLTTELDPNYIQVYRFGGIFLPDLNAAHGIAFLQRGIANNPTDWRLYQDLAYVYWKQQRFQEASEIYGKGSRLPGAPEWMKALQAVTLLRGGDRATAREIFLRMYQQSEDALTRQLSLSRLQSIQAEDEISFLNRLLEAWRARAGACPPSLNALVKSLSPVALKQIRQSGMQFDENGNPLDPAGAMYSYRQAECTIRLHEKSGIVRWKA